MAYRRRRRAAALTVAALTVLTGPSVAIAAEENPQLARLCQVRVNPGAEALSAWQTATVADLTVHVNRHMVCVDTAAPPAEGEPPALLPLDRDRVKEAFPGDAPPRGPVAIADCGGRGGAVAGQAEGRGTGPQLPTKSQVSRRDETAILEACGRELGFVPDSGRAHGSLGGDLFGGASPSTPKGCTTGARPGRDGAPVREGEALTFGEVAWSLWKNLVITASFAVSATKGTGALAASEGAGAAGGAAFGGLSGGTGFVAWLTEAVPNEARELLAKGTRAQADAAANAADVAATAAERAAAAAEEAEDPRAGEAKQHAAASREAATKAREAAVKAHAATVDKEIGDAKKEAVEAAEKAKQESAKAVDAAGGTNPGTQPQGPDGGTPGTTDDGDEGTKGTSTRDPSAKAELCWELTAMQYECEQTGWKTGPCTMLLDTLSGCDRTAIRVDPEAGEPCRETPLTPDDLVRAQSKLCKKALIGLTVDGSDPCAMLRTDGNGAVRLQCDADLVRTTGEPADACGNSTVTFQPLQPKQPLCLKPPVVGGQPIGPSVPCPDGGEGPGGGDPPPTITDPYGGKP